MSYKLKLQLSVYVQDVKDQTIAESYRNGFDRNFAADRQRKPGAELSGNYPPQRCTPVTQP